MSKKNRRHGKQRRKFCGYETGTRVEFIEEAMHRLYPHLYPPAGTLGTITKFSTPHHYMVLWDGDVISYKGEWYYNHKFLRKIAG